MALTDCERAFVRAAMDTDDQNEQVRLYRKAKCKGCDNSDARVKTQARQLLAREDAKQYVSHRRARREVFELENVRRQADAEWDEQQQLMELRRDVIDGLRLLVNDAGVRAKAPQAYAKVIDTAGKIGLLKGTIGDLAGKERASVAAEVERLKKELGVGKKPKQKKQSQDVGVIMVQDGGVA